MTEEALYAALMCATPDYFWGEYADVLIRDIVRRAGDVLMINRGAHEGACYMAGGASRRVSVPVRMQEDGDSGGGKSVVRLQALVYMLTHGDTVLPERGGCDPGAVHKGRGVALVSCTHGGFTGCINPAHLTVKALPDMMRVTRVDDARGLCGGVFCASGGGLEAGARSVGAYRTWADAWSHSQSGCSDDDGGGDDARLGSPSVASVSDAASQRTSSSLLSGSSMGSFASASHAEQYRALLEYWPRGGGGGGR